MNKEVVVHGNFHALYEDATVWLALNKGLFTQLMYSLPNEVSSGKVPTACTTGRGREFSKEFLDGLNAKQQAGIMAHEIAHEILQHLPRGERKDPKLWNFACDLKINNMLIESGFELPTGGVFDYRGERFPGKSEEFIYDFIQEEERKNPGGIPKGYVGDMDMSEPLTKDEVVQLTSRVEAAVNLHGMGNVSAELKAAIEAIIRPPESWHEWLRKYFVAKQYSGCDWKSMCRREYVRSGIVAPPFQSDSLGTVVISVDQSGSISQKMLAHFNGHVNSILMDCRPEKVIVQYFDIKVHETEEFLLNDLPITLRRVCGGGTSFVNPCAMAEEYEATVHIVLTDMYGDFPDGSTIPTVWASTSNVGTAPFGDVVRIELN